MRGLILTILFLTLGGFCMAEEMPKTACDAVGFYHSWEDVTPNVVYPTNPPQYPPHTEKCRNCGLIRYEKTVKKVGYNLESLKKGVGK